MKTTSTSRRFGLRLVSPARAFLAVLALAALAVPTRSLAQAPTFNTLISTYKGDPNYAHPGGAAVGDFNGDGKLDSVVFDGTSTIHMLLGNGDGTFAEHRVDIPLITAGNAVGLNPAFVPYLPHPIDGVIRSIKAVDVNGDGKLDIVCLFVTHINFAPLWGTTVLINGGNDANGVPQFTTATHYFAPFADDRSLTIGDVNGDGKPDFIVGFAYGGLQVYLNNGDGTFAAGQTMSLQPGAGGPAVGPGVIADLNGDGKADYLVTSNQNAGANIFFGNGDGTFQAPVFVPNTANAVSIVVADLNKDGKPDFVVGNADGTVGVFLNNGGGSFSAPTLYSTGGSPGWNGVTPVAVGDVNGDGKLDIVVADSANNTVEVLLGDGSGAFGSPTLFRVNQIPVDVTVADFNGDGKPDIGIVGYNDDSYGVLTNTTPFPAPAQIFFTDALTGPGSPNLTIPSGKYGYTVAGLERTQSNSETDRPVVATRLGSYLTTTQFTATVTVDLTSPDIAYFGFGQGTPDPTYFQEPTNAFLFRIHNQWTGYSGIQVWPTHTVSGFNSPDHFFGFVDGGTLGTYGGGSLTLMIQRNGDSLTMSIPSMNVSHTFSISQYAAQMGLTGTSTYVFFGNTSVGSVFSDLKIYRALPAPVVTSASVSAGYGSAFSYTISATNSPTGYGATNLPFGLALNGNVISGTLPNTLGTSIIGLSATNAGGTGIGTLTLTILDPTPPMIASLTPSVTSIWPPNKKMVPVTLSAGGTNLGGNVTFRITSVTTNEPDGKAQWQITGPLTLNLLADRLGTGTGRIYTITVTATDAAGNFSTKTCTVTVPHDQGR